MDGTEPESSGDAAPSLTLAAVEGLTQIAQSEWDAIANPDGAESDPFLSWNFLQALEESGCVGGETGWMPHHLTARDEAGGLRGALPLYLKFHSQGEYVFDHGWAEGFERAGGRYYPKLLTAVPFTPVTGRRILAPDAPVRRALIGGMIEAARQWGVSSWHVNFPTPGEWADLGEAELLQRIDRQFVWHNRGYGSYDDFLADLSSRKRKALRKERASAQAGLEIEHLTGADLRVEHWDAFFACYQDTGARKWGRPYLNRVFFELIHQRMADQVLLVLAKRDGRYIAAALNFLGSHALYGRYWGLLEDHPHLHFELCYHQAIDVAIALKLDRVEAGAQGEHKLARGYRPQPVYSAHWIAHEGFRHAIADYLEHERPAMLADIALLDEKSPYNISD
ncbi:GNAT family N-acetyltransferase [uncultured Maricaulis sp.]|uniref:GNAT family N-acetyltransferase n=1 Tax=uncultured Maricaulis sp. TaxID=174710 RepID=UPI0030DCA851|tara:strand:- start:37761 stop:38942 length:1182 start_codon:yes stop_codon:yes gene_type:complete